MPQITERVQPGDIISAELFNRMIAMLNAHESQLAGGHGDAVVPDLFGRTLSDARLALEAQQLSLGSVVDVFGAVVAPGAAAASRLVLNQVPVAGSRTVTRASVHLVVAATSAGSGPTGPANPQINEIVPDRQHRDGDIEVRGTGFVHGAVVTFDGIAGTVHDTSTQSRLLVRVPRGIPGAPSAPGDPDRSGVVIRVTNPGGEPVTAETRLTLSAPPADPLTIGEITPATGRVGQSIRIIGTGFSTTASQNVVRFDDAVGEVTAAAATELTVTVPSIPGLVAPGDSRFVNVTVTRTTDDTRSGIEPHRIRL
jgi:hypothetical protein